MKCPVCRQKGDVMETRHLATSIRRRRSCTGCRHRWTTYEISKENFEELLKGARVVNKLRELL